MTPAPPPARQRFNPRGRAAALPSSYTTTRDTTAKDVPGSVRRRIGLDGVRVNDHTTTHTSREHPR